MEAAMAERPAAAAAAASEGEDVPDIDPFELAEQLKNKLEEADRKSIDDMEGSLTQADKGERKAAVLEQIADRWEKAGYMEIGAIYYEAAAKERDTPAAWTVAADKLGDAFRISEEPNFKKYLVGHAITAYQTAVDKKPEDIELQTRLAASYIDGYPGQSQVMQGVLLLLDIVKKDPEALDAHFMLGKMAIVSGQLDKAVMRFEKVIELEPNHVDAHFYMGESYAQLGEYDKAVKVLEKCKSLAKNPTFVDRLTQYIKTLTNK